MTHAFHGWGTYPEQTQRCNRPYRLYLSAWVVFTQATKVAENLKARFHIAIVRSLRKITSGISKEQIFQTTDCSLYQTSSLLPTHLPTRGLLEYSFEIVVVFQKIPGSPTSKEQPAKPWVIASSRGSPCQGVRRQSHLFLFFPGRGRIFFFLSSFWN